MARISHAIIQVMIPAILGVVCAGVINTYAWTGPTQSPPAGNVATILNPSSVAQVKDGGLGVTTLIGNQFCLGSSCITNWPEADLYACSSSHYAEVRYATSTAGLQYCNGTSWIPFSIN